jgi:hypothetical protein
MPSFSLRFIMYYWYHTYYVFLLCLMDLKASKHAYFVNQYYICLYYAFYKANYPVLIYLILSFILFTKQATLSKYILYYLVFFLQNKLPCLNISYYTPAPQRGRGVYCFTSVLPSVQDIFRRIFLSNCWWQKSDIWSQASYRYTISWEAFLDLSDSCFLFADLVDLYTHWTYMHIFCHIFLSNYWWQRSDIWSQASYRYPISWEAFLDSSDSYFLFADLVGFYTHWTYMHIFRHIFLSNYWWQKSDNWSQASYRYPISWEAFLDLSDSYFLFAKERGYHRWALAHSSSCFT